MLRHIKNTSERGNDDEPVSYTHLDVYKRQKDGVTDGVTEGVTLGSIDGVIEGEGDGDGEDGFLP